MNSCRVDLHHSRLWVGTEVMQDDFVPKTTDSDPLHKNTEADQMEEIEIDEIEIKEELAKHAELELQIKKLQEQTAQAKNITSKAVAKIGEMEPNLLLVTEETAEVG